jgi:RNA-directed DNA polymerase
MTKPPYQPGWSAGSQVSDIAVASGYARNVNLNNGNSNWNHQDNHNQALAVRASECTSVSFAALHAAYRNARRGKKPSADQLAFDATWLDQLLDLQERLQAGTWHPSAPTCFIVTDPKHRQIHAPAFADRVVHHWLVPQLEAIYERTFIHDSYSNRCRKGTHAAVCRLEAFVRQVACGQHGGWYLQLDVSTFFNSIHRPTLYRLLKDRMVRAQLPETVRRATHALLNYPLSRTGVHWAATLTERESVPQHKRLENAAPGCGIAIGNLSSQFFANVYLDRLDQFVKHTLKARRYLRYVDDFVLVHRDHDQLESWRIQIQDFLRDELRLELKSDQRLKPLVDGIDFLGYVVRPTHTVVRRRVVAHARSKLAAFERSGDRSPRALDLIRSVWQSYAGHFRHAASWRLVKQLRAQFSLATESET